MNITEYDISDGSVAHSDVRVCYSCACVCLRKKLVSVHGCKGQGSPSSPVTH